MDENNGDNFNNKNNDRFHRTTFKSTISPTSFSEYLRAGPEDQANLEGAVRFASSRRFERLGNPKYLTIHQVDFRVQ